MDIPDEKDTAELNAIYAYNGYYNKSKGREEMLQKNTYFENLKDFVDEQLCTVASQISWKKALEKTKLECLMKLHWYEQEMKDDIKRGEKMQDDLDKVIETNLKMSNQMSSMRDELDHVRAQISHLLTD